MHECSQYTVYVSVHLCIYMCMLGLFRLGGGETDAVEVMKHIFFESIDWHELYDKKVIKQMYHRHHFLWH